MFGSEAQWNGEPCLRVRCWAQRPNIAAARGNLNFVGASRAEGFRELQDLNRNISVRIADSLVEDVFYRELRVENTHRMP